MVSIDRDAGNGRESDRYWTDRLLDLGFGEEDVLLHCGYQLCPDAPDHDQNSGLLTHRIILHHR